MNDRTHALAEHFDRASADFIAMVEGCDEERWRAISDDKGWSVGTVARHVAWGVRAEARLVANVAAGRELPSLTLADIDGSNARNAKKHVSPDRARTVRLLREEPEKALELLRALDDEQLDRSEVGAFMNPKPQTVEQIVRRLLIWHVEFHAKGVRAALA